MNYVDLFDHAKLGTLSTIDARLAVGQALTRAFTHTMNGHSSSNFVHSGREFFLMHNDIPEGHLGYIREADNETYSFLFPERVEEDEYEEQRLTIISCNNGIYSDIQMSPKISYGKEYRENKPREIAVNLFDHVNKTMLATVPFTFGPRYLDPNLERATLYSSALPLGYSSRIEFLKQIPKLEIVDEPRAIALEYVLLAHFVDKSLGNETFPANHSLNLYFKDKVEAYQRSVKFWYGI
jgi:hypothetical protein